MIDLEKHYRNKNINELVEIVESIDTYNSDVIDYCKVQIKEKNLSDKIIKLLSIGVIKKRFYDYFSKRKYIVNSPINFNSVFLSTDEVKKCFEESKLEYTEYIKDANWGLPDWG
jgi:hypothetical protein